MTPIILKRKVILPLSIVSKSTCDRCGEFVSNKYGEQRQEIFKLTEDGIKYDTRMICSHCIDVLFIEHELNNKPCLFDYL